MTLSGAIKQRAHATLTLVRLCGSETNESIAFRRMESVLRPDKFQSLEMQQLVTEMIGAFDVLGQLGGVPQRP